MEMRRRTSCFFWKCDAGYQLSCQAWRQLVCCLPDMAALRRPALQLCCLTPLDYALSHCQALASGAPSAATLREALPGAWWVVGRADCCCVLMVLTAVLPGSWWVQLLVVCNVKRVRTHCTACTFSATCFGCR